MVEPGGRPDSQSLNSAGMLSRTFAALAIVVGALSACTSKGAVTPARLIDLADWKLTLPVGGPREGWPQEITQPQLNTYRSEFFQPAPDGSSVLFRAPVFGMVQPGSNFARTELREMTADGSAKAAWSNRRGQHAMEITQRITALPEIRPALVAGQIHDADEYVVLIKLDANRLYVKAENREIGVLDDDYTLGKLFTVRLVAAEGRIRIFYQGDLKVDYARSCETCYFKAGAYLQANPGSGKNRRQAESGDFGEVAISSLTVTHSPPL